MALFYRREEKTDTVTIRFVHTPIVFLVVFIGSIASMFMGNNAGNMLWLLIWIFVGVYIFDVMKPGKEIRQAKQEGSVRFSGSRFSLKNPLTVTIRNARKLDSSSQEQ